MSARFQTRRNNQKKSIFPRILLILFILIFVIGVYFYSAIRSIGSYLLPESAYTITSGMNLSNLSESLDWNVPPSYYRLWVKFFAPEANLKVGRYDASGMTIEEFFTSGLATPIHTDNTIQILPGWNMYDMDAYFARENVLATGAFLAETKNIAKYQTDYTFLAGVDSLEGFLIPDTYRISQSADAEAIIRVMLDQFEKEIAPMYEELGDNAYRTLIMASIVEREERSAENRPVVAGILWKRLREGIALGADVTLCYGYQKTNSACTPSFIAEHITEDNPYNTRYSLGLPPTPISSISIGSWNASMNPAESPYYFYLHGSDGTIHYATTNEEHVRNKNLYLQ